MIYVLSVVVFLLVALQVQAIFFPKPIKKNIFDTKQQYLEEINTFIQRETIFEFLKWILNESDTTIITTNGSGNVRSDFAEQIKDNAVVKKRSSLITIMIIDRMSDDLKRAFYRLYNKRSKEVLEMYVSRWVIFFIRKTVAELTERLARDTTTKYTSVIKVFAYDLEQYLYRISKIDFTIQPMMVSPQPPLPMK